MSSSIDPDSQSEILRQQIYSSLDKAQAHRNNLKRANTRYSIVNILLSAAATFIAGQAAVTGNPINSWRFTCMIASGYALGATVTAGLQKQLADPDLLTEASECVGKLKSLKIETIAPTYDLQEVSDKYEQILSEFSSIDC